jgi:hypothetical protein
MTGMKINRGARAGGFGERRLARYLLEISHDPGSVQVGFLEVGRLGNAN